MARKPHVNQNLPVNLRARHRGKNTYYYYDCGGRPRKEIPLGKDYLIAVQEWSKLEAEKIPKTALPNFLDMASRYRNEIIPKKALSTQRSHKSCLKKLTEYFGNPPAPLDEIDPIHISKYLQWRKEAPAQANLEVRIFSHMWNCSREWGYTSKANPTTGIKKLKEQGRSDVYIENLIFNKVYEQADPIMRDLMDVTYLTGQRPVDVVKIHANDIVCGVLQIHQQKTKAVVRIALKGRLKEVVDKILRDGEYLFANKTGGKLTAAVFGVWFAEVRLTAAEANPDISTEILQFQIRDLRAKAGTDKALKFDDMAAQKQLGHASLSMTKRYIRRSRVVDPTE